MAENLLLEEADFQRFRQYCRTRGFDLSYYGPEISGSRKDIESYQFDSPKVVRLQRRRLGFSGVPYDVPWWQKESWLEAFSRLKSEFHG